MRLCGARNWIEQRYKQTRQDFGWADFMVRDDRSIYRHWSLVCCAFSFCWQAWFTDQPMDDRAPGEPAAAEWAKKQQEGADPKTAVVSWLQTFRLVRSWLDLWTTLWRYWHAWSDLSPPAELRAILDWDGQDRPLQFYLRLCRVAG